jgi:hypothetical protein
LRVVLALFVDQPAVLPGHLGQRNGDVDELVDLWNDGGDLPGVLGDVLVGEDGGRSVEAPLDASLMRHTAVDDVEIVGLADRRGPTEFLDIGDEADLGGLAGIQVDEEDIRLELGVEPPRAVAIIIVDAVADDGLARLDRRPFRT